MCCDWSNVSKVIYEVGAEDLSLNDAPRSGRPVEVNNQTKTLTENSQHYTMKQKANILKIADSSTKNHLHQLGYITICFDVWVPHKWKKKTLTVVPHFCLSLKKNFDFKNKLWQMMKTEHWTIMRDGRDHTASEMNHGQPHQRLVFIQRSWCCVVFMVGLEKSPLLWALSENQIINSNKYCSHLDQPRAALDESIWS